MSHKLFCTLAIPSLVVVLALGVGAATVQAAVINLVENGEFEQPSIASGFTKTPDGGVPGWSNPSTGLIELWKQGNAGSPPLGSDTLPTGQHMELTVNGGGELNTQSFVIPPLATGTATFSFDAWPRTTNDPVLNFSVSRTPPQSGPLPPPSLILAAGALDLSASPTVWTSHNFPGLPVSPGDTIGIVFSTPPNSNDSGPHIDQVEFLVNVVPEAGAMALALLGVGFVAVGPFRSRHGLRNSSAGMHRQ